MNRSTGHKIKKITLLLIVLSLLVLYCYCHDQHDHAHHDHNHEHHHHEHDHDHEHHHHHKHDHSTIKTTATSTTTTFNTTNNNIGTTKNSNSWIQALSASFFVSLLSFSGALLLMSKMSSRLSFFLTSLAIGSLLGDTFLHLLPAIYGTHSHGPPSSTSVGHDHSHDHDNHHHSHDSHHHHHHHHEFDYGVVILFGFILCFFTEMIIRYIQHTSSDTSDGSQKKKQTSGHSHSHSHIKAFGWLNLFSDGFHNFMDGMGLAGAFHVSTSLGLATTLCICFHELPQEMSDFGVLLSAGFSAKRALLFNFLSGIIAVIGCLVGLTLQQQAALMSSSSSSVWIIKLLNEKALISITAGSFLYIIASMTQELWAQIFEEENRETPVSDPDVKLKTTKKNKKTQKQNKNNTRQEKTGSNIITSLLTSVVGVSLGLIIMYFIGLAEHDIMALFAV